MRPVRQFEPESTIEAIAHEVGYSTAFALSAAFKRERGISPKEHREQGLVSQGPAGSAARPG